MRKYESNMGSVGGVDIFEGVCGNLQEVVVGHADAQIARAEVVRHGEVRKVVKGGVIARDARGVTHAGWRGNARVRVNVK